MMSQGLSSRDGMMVGLGIVVGMLLLLLIRRIFVSKSKPVHEPPSNLKPKEVIPSTPLTSSADPAQVAQLLASKNVTAYVSSRCGWCTKQKAEFGDEWKNVPSVDCDAHPDQCKGKGLPTWKGPDGKEHPGYMNLARLSALFG